MWYGPGVAVADCMYRVISCIMAIHLSVFGSTRRPYICLAVSRFNCLLAVQPQLFSKAWTCLVDLEVLFTVRLPNFRTESCKTILFYSLFIFVSFFVVAILPCCCTFLMATAMGFFFFVSFSYLLWHYGHNVGIVNIVCQRTFLLFILALCFVRPLIALLCSFARSFPPSGALAKVLFSDLFGILLPWYLVGFLFLFAL